MDIKERAQQKITNGQSVKSVAKDLGVKAAWVKSIAKYPVKFNFGIEAEVIDGNYDLFEQRMFTSPYKLFSNLDYHETPWNFQIKNQLHWRLMDDGSVDKELVSPILQGEDGVEIMKDVISMFRDSETEVDHKCGLHVHIGRDCFDGPGHIINFQLVYAMLENSIQEMLDDSRKDNHFCEPIEEDLSEYGMGLRTYGRSKYKTVNSSPLHTIEIRHHQGTVDPDEIEDWLRILQQLVDYSRKHTLTRPTSLESVICVKSQKVVKNRKKKKCA